jgi:dTDP-4-amino-4,6-dideoxy-D-galactose acyltransferase
MTAMLYDPLEWDSRFFGLNIGRLKRPPASREELSEIMAAARRDRVDCLYALLPADAEQSAWRLEQEGFVARDVRLELAVDVPGDPPSAGRPCEEADLPALEDIAEEAFTATRFASDPEFSRSSVRQLYRTWIANSYRGFAEAVLVDGPAGQQHGFVTLHREGEGVARIGLIGVAASQRSRGVGSRLIAAALGWSASQGCVRTHVYTQAKNVGAQRLYQRAGFTTVSAFTWYHCWPSRNTMAGPSP